VSKRTTILAGAAVLLIATVLAYLPATRGGFVWDDEDWVEHNPLLVDADGMWRIWFSNDQPSQYFPMVYTTFRLEYSIWGLEPLGYHVTNIVLHAINVLLVWWLLARLRVPAAWLASAVFALHPVQVESVAWITERKNVLMFFFFALALGAWLTFVDRSEQPRRGRSFYLLSLGLYVIALLAKTTASTMPAALVLTLWMKHLRVDRRRWLQITPFVVLGVAAGLLSMWWERFYQGVYPSVVYEGPIERLLIASHGVWFYLGKLAWPTSFTFSYPKWSISAADPALYIWPVLCLVATWGLWRWRSRIGRGPIAAMVFFVATLSPLLGLIMLATFVYTYVADHYQYVACIGPIALACATGHGIARRFGRQGLRLGSAVAVIVLVLLGTLTWRQGAIYASRETVWRDTLRKNPNSWLAHNNLGTALRSQGRFEEAAGHYRQALLLDRDLEGSSGRIHFNLADMLAAQGDHEQAIEHYRQALQEHPGNYLAHHNMANSMVKWDRSDDATVHYRRALEIRPDYAAGHHNLANLLRSQGNLDEALMHYERALEIDPGHANSHKGLALLLSGRGAVTEAIDHYRAALETDPDDAETHYNLGNALRSQGRLEVSARGGRGSHRRVDAKQPGPRALHPGRRRRSDRATSNGPADAARLRRRTLQPGSDPGQTRPAAGSPDRVPRGDPLAARLAATPHEHGFHSRHAPRSGRARRGLSDRAGGTRGRADGERRSTGAAHARGGVRGRWPPDVRGADRRGRPPAGIGPGLDRAGATDRTTAPVAPPGAAVTERHKVSWRPRSIPEYN
jgi:tetratricopeptide (TPR) repeat protein